MNSGAREKNNNNNRLTGSRTSDLVWLTVCIDNADRYLDEFAYPFGVAEAIGVT